MWALLVEHGGELGGGEGGEMPGLGVLIVEECCSEGGGMHGLEMVTACG